MSITNRVQAAGPSARAKRLASEYVRIHNEASKKYKEAFKKVGARMWMDDDCHLIKPTAVDFIAKHMGDGLLPSVYRTLPRPLTILDSYPEVKADKKKMKQLNKEVDDIHREANADWDDVCKRTG